LSGRDPLLRLTLAVRDCGSWPEADGQLLKTRSKIELSGRTRLTADVGDASAVGMIRASPLSSALAVLALFASTLLAGSRAGSTITGEHALC
ncbi:hypothetical protein, partial [Roseomonas sp. KE2513]|uniref:hypothetical protein n=1 Tax=Roseomonas sp. KE2513 TaxID=2479202 RepID=UPI001E32E099